MRPRNFELASNGDLVPTVIENGLMDLVPWVGLQHRQEHVL